jgi:hypothetical protein
MNSNNSEILTTEDSHIFHPVYAVASQENERGASFRVSEPGSLVSVVSGYGMDDWAIQFRAPAEAKEFLL